MLSHKTLNRDDMLTNSPRYIICHYLSSLDTGRLQHKRLNESDLKSLCKRFYRPIQDVCCYRCKRLMEGVTHAWQKAESGRILQMCQYKVKY